VERWLFVLLLTACRWCCWLFGHIKHFPAIFPPPAEPLVRPPLGTLIIVIEFAKLRLKYNGLVCLPAGKKIVDHLAG